MMQSKLFEDPVHVYGMCAISAERRENLEQREKFLRIARMLRAELEVVHRNLMEVFEK